MTFGKFTWGMSRSKSTSKDTDFQRIGSRIYIRTNKQMADSREMMIAMMCIHYEYNRYWSRANNGRM